jgi:dTDP-glucose 4,6-dehydratase
MNIRNKKVLVTGADGFIGSHLTEELVKKGCDVRAMVLYNSFGSWGWLDRAPAEVKKSLDVVLGDVRDYACVRKAMEGCDTVLHLAALIAIPYSYRAPHSYVETNVVGTLNVLQAAGETGVSKIVHTSTSEVYGTAEFVPITEEHRLSAQSPYAASKIGADQMALSFNKSFDTPVAIIRPFNTYGPRQSARAVIPTIITQIASGKKCVKIGSTETTRDFNYIEDTVRGFIAVAEADASIGDVFNIGSNFEVSIGKTIELIAELMGERVTTEKEEARLRPQESEVERLCADYAKAKRLFGWQPEYAGEEGFRAGLKKTIDWFVRPDNLAAYKVEAFSL